MRGGEGRKIRDVGVSPERGEQLDNESGGKGEEEGSV